MLQHRIVAGDAEGLGVSWHTANTAIIVEGKGAVIDHPTRLDGVAFLGVLATGLSAKVVFPCQMFQEAPAHGGDFALRQAATVRNPVHDTSRLRKPPMPPKALARKQIDRGSASERFVQTLPVSCTLAPSRTSGPKSWSLQYLDPSPQGKTYDKWRNAPGNFGSDGAYHPLGSERRLLMEALTDIERLVAIEAIKQLKSRRDRALDLKEFDVYESYTPPTFAAALQVRSHRH